MSKQRFDGFVGEAGGLIRLQLVDENDNPRDTAELVEGGAEIILVRRDGTATEPRELELEEPSASGIVSTRKRVTDFTVEGTYEIHLRLRFADGADLQFVIVPRRLNIGRTRFTP